MNRIAIVCMLTLPVGACRSPRPYVQTRAVNEITSTVLSGTRSRKPTLFTWEPVKWEVTIEVRVEASGPAFGGFQISSLTVKEEGAFQDSRFWFGPSHTDYYKAQHGSWPDFYVVKARYQDLGDSAGNVYVTVTVGDTDHRSYGSVVYQATHPITWDESSTPSPTVPSN